jgi:hypothetical protein
MAEFQIQSHEDAVIHMRKFEGHAYQHVGGSSLEEVIISKPYPIFHSNIIEFFDKLSSLCWPLCARPNLRGFSAFFFYSRARNLRQLFANSGYSRSSVGLGVSLNISPSNVPLNSFYSLLFTSLSGSPCILRVSQDTLIALRDFFPIFNQVYNNYVGKIPSIAIITYPKSSELTTHLSHYSKSRVVWGGDETAQHIRKLPCPPNCRDIYFTNRQSCAVVNIDSLFSCPDFKHLLSSFANDIALFAQQACSSPLHIFFYGSNITRTESINTFFRELDHCICSSSLREYTSKDCLESALSFHLSQPLLRVSYVGQFLRAYKVNSDFEDNIRTRVRNGNLTFTLSSSLHELPFSLHYQTIVFLPYPDAAERKQFFELFYYFFDRLVKPGRAIDMNLFWDGHDIVRTLSRRVSY